ncbi:MAG: TonB-dependent receptor [Woeseiaceae bacterium]|nr:TonB-dependent receptor [Woeseiaceae bacterium]
MQTIKLLAVAGMVMLPFSSVADDAVVGDEQEPDEIVVVGRSIATSSARIEVERELLVDTAAALRDIPGATVNRNGPLTGIAQYRGMFGDRIAVDIDALGVISGGPNAMDAPLSYMSPMMTEELVVTRGIASVSLAPEAIGGHVSTRTSRGDFGSDDLGLSGMIGTRYSDNGNISTTAARLTLASEQHRLSAIAEFDSGDDIETPKGDIVPTRIDRDRYDVSYGYDDGSREILLFAGKLETGETGTPALPMDIIFIDTELYGARLGFDVSDNVRIDGRFGYNDVAHVMDNFSLRQAPMAMRQRLNTTSGSGSQFFLAATVDRNGSSWQFGIDGIDAAHDSVITNPNNAMFRVDNFIDVERRLIGAFAELTRDLGDGQFELGARYNRVSTDAGEVGAAGMMGDMGTRIGELAQAFNAANRDLDWGSLDVVGKYRWHTSATTEWSVEIGSKSRAPSYQELYLWLPLQATGGLADGRTYVGSLDLEAEESRELVVGVGTEIGRFAMTPQLYFRRVDDYILGVPSGNMLANMVATMMSGSEPLQFDNVDAEIWGLDAAWSYELSDNLLLDGIVSLARGKRTDTNDPLYRLSPLNGSVGLTYAAEKWSLKSEVIGFADQDRVSSINNELETPGYWLVNLGFRWNPVQSLRVEARVDNLFDEAYQNHVTGINRAAGSDVPVGERLWGAGRTLSAGVVYRF